MKNLVLEKALTRRAELVKKLAEIDRFIKTYNTLNKADSQDQPKAKGWAGRTSDTQVILDAVADILSKESPLKPADIVSRLKHLDIRIEGKNPANNISAKLSGAKDRFKTLGRGMGWTLLK